MVKWRNSGGEAEWPRGMIEGTFAICNRGLVKLSPCLPLIKKIYDFVLGAKTEEAKEEESFSVESITIEIGKNFETRQVKKNINSVLIFDCIDLIAIHCFVNLG
jgi:hypothetical protein